MENIPTEILADKLGGIMVFIIVLLAMILVFCYKTYKDK